MDIKYQDYRLKFNKAYIKKRAKELKIKLYDFAFLVYGYESGSYISYRYEMNKEHSLLRKMSKMCAILDCSPNDLLMMDKIMVGKVKHVKLEEINKFSISENNKIVTIMNEDEYDNTEIEW